MDNKSFDFKRIAEGYAHRPWLHQSVMEQIKSDCDISQNFDNGLDVGCGAGLSTKALRLLCNKVTGTDISEAMIQVCKSIYHDKDYDFYVASAEDTPVPARKYDIVTAAGVINWVEKERFLQNMHAVMKPKGLLVIYDFWISDKMVDAIPYTEWYQNEYLAHFPKPPRKENVWSQGDVGEFFCMKQQVTYEMQYQFSLEAFIDFMMIQSNVNVRIEGGEKTEDEVRSWMIQTLEPIFRGQERILVFKGYNWYMQHR